MIRVCGGGGGGKGRGDCKCLRVNRKLFFSKCSPSTLLTWHTSNVELDRYRIFYFFNYSTVTAIRIFFDQNTMTEQ